MSEIDEIPGRSPPAKPHRARTILLGLLATLLALAVGVAGTGLYLQHRLSSQVDRIDDVFAGLDTRPARPAGGHGAAAVNILLMVTDRGPADSGANGINAWSRGTPNTDALMVLHVDADRRGATVISIPRNAWVRIPGHGANTINTAFSLERPSLAVHTVENLTDLRIDHFAVFGWAGFEELTDALGGIILNLPETVHDAPVDVTWDGGRQWFRGSDALDYVVQRYELPGGDADWILRQQNFLRAVLDTTLHQEFRSEPIQVYKVLNTVTKNLAVDREWSVGEMRDLAVSLRNMRSASIQYVTVPIARTETKGRPGVVHLDVAGNRELWSAVREDEVGTWLGLSTARGAPGRSHS